jgi:hypothetical protein
VQRDGLAQMMTGNDILGSMTPLVSHSFTYCDVHRSDFREAIKDTLSNRRPPNRYDGAVRLPPAHLRKT